MTADDDRDLPTELSDAEVVAERWDGADLSGRTFQRVTFLDVDLTEASGSGVTFEHCTFRDCDLNAARFTDSAFVNCTFVRSSLFGARLEGCKLVGTAFDRCRFGAFEAVGGSWRFVRLPAADLRKTTFRRVDLREADLSAARFGGATLHHLDLVGAELHQTDFTGADLRGSDLSTFDLRDAVVRKAVVDLDQAVALVRSLGIDVREEVPLDPAL